MHRRQFFQSKTVTVYPGRKLSHGLGVGSASVWVAVFSREKFDEALSNGLAGVGEEGRHHCLGKRCEWSGWGGDQFMGHGPTAAMIAVS